MNEKVALISCFCDNEEKINVLKENIKHLRDNYFDIILISPLALPEDVVLLCDHFLYIKDNIILEWPINVQMYFIEKNIDPTRFFKLITTNKDYGWAGLNHVKKLTDIALLFEYKSFCYMIYDINIDEDVLNILKNPKDNWIGSFERNGVKSNCSLHLMSFNRKNAEKMNGLINLENYIEFLNDKTQNGSTEAFVEIIKNKLNSESGSFFIKDKIHLYRNFFNHSPCEQVSFFVHKDSNNITSNLKIFFYANKDITKIQLTINKESRDIDISCDLLVDLVVSFLDLDSACILVENKTVDILESIKSIKYSFIDESNA